MPHTIPLRVRQGLGILLLLHQSAHVRHRMSPHVAELGSLLEPSNFANFKSVEDIEGKGNQPGSSALQRPIRRPACLEPHFILRAGERCPSTNPSEAEQPVVIVKALHCGQRSSIPRSRSGAVTRSTAACLDAHASGTWPSRRQESRGIHTCITYTDSRRQASRAAGPHLLSPPHRVSLKHREQPAGGLGVGSRRWGSRPPVTAK